MFSKQYSTQILKLNRNEIKKSQVTILMAWSTYSQSSEQGSGPGGTAGSRGGSSSTSGLPLTKTNKYVWVLTCTFKDQTGTKWVKYCDLSVASTSIIFLCGRQRLTLKATY